MSKLTVLTVKKLENKGERSMSTTLKDLLRCPECGEFLSDNIIVNPANEEFTDGVRCPNGCNIELFWS